MKLKPEYSPDNPLKLKLRSFKDAIIITFFFFQHIALMKLLVQMKPWFQYHREHGPPHFTEFPGALAKRDTGWVRSCTYWLLHMYPRF